MNKKFSNLKSFIFYILIFFGLYPIIEILLGPKNGVFLLSIKYPPLISFLTVLAIICFIESSIFKRKVYRALFLGVMICSLMLSLRNFHPLELMNDRDQYRLKSPIDGKNILIAEKRGFHSQWTVYSKELFVFYVPIGTFESETAEVFAGFVKEIDWTENKLVLTYPEYSKIVTDVYDYSKHTKTRIGRE